MATPTHRSTAQLGSLKDERSFRAALISLAKNGDPTLISELSENRAMMDTRDSHKKTLLMMASERGHLALAGSLLSIGADPRALDDHRNSALILASFGGHGDVAKLLAPVSEMAQRNGFGWNGLMGAAVSGDVDLISFLVARGADPKDADAGGRTPLMKAVRYNRLDAVRFLAPISPIDAADVDGDTALLKACRYGLAEIARVLRLHGADPLAEDLRGESCIKKARKHGFLELAESLLKPL